MGLVDQRTEALPELDHRVGVQLTDGSADGVAGVVFDLDLEHAASCAVVREWRWYPATGARGQDDRTSRWGRRARRSAGGADARAAAPREMVATEGVPGRAAGRCLRDRELRSRSCPRSCSQRIPTPSTRTSTPPSTP